MLVTATESEPIPKLICDQDNGNSALQGVGMVLKINDMDDCESSALYVTKQHEMTKPEVCDSLIDNILEKLTGDIAAKTLIRGMYNLYGIDQETTKVNDLCKCTCSKGNAIISLFYIFNYFDFDIRFSYSVYILMKMISNNYPIFHWSGIIFMI